MSLVSQDRKSLPTISPFASSLIPLNAAEEPKNEVLASDPVRSKWWKWAALLPVLVCFVSAFLILRGQPKVPTASLVVEKKADFQDTNLGREANLDSVAKLDRELDDEELAPALSLPKPEVVTKSERRVPISVGRWRWTHRRPADVDFQRDHSPKLQQSISLPEQTNAKAVVEFPPRIIPSEISEPAITVPEIPQLAYPYETALHGTKIPWTPSLNDAISFASESEKLVFVILVSGNFAREEFT